MTRTPALLSSRLAGLDRPGDQSVRDQLILDAMGDTAAPVREVAIAWAARCFEPAALLPLVADPGNAILRNAALAALERQGPYAVGEVEDATASADPDLAMFACQVLGSIGVASSTAPLLAALRRPETNVVQAAAEALGRLGSPAAVSGLVDLLARDPWLQLAAADALGAIGDPAAVLPLLTLVPDSLMAEPALEALRRIASPAALPRLLALIEDPGHIRLRAALLLAIGAILERDGGGEPLAFGARVESDHGPGSLWRFLTECLGDAGAAAAPGRNDDRSAARSGGPSLRAASALALAAGIDSLLPLVLRWAHARDIREWLAPLVARQEGRLSRAADRLSAHPDEAVRAGALAMLPPQAVGAERLGALLADEAPMVRVAACEALARWPVPALVRPLVSLLDRGAPAERAAAARALVRLPEAQVAKVAAGALDGAAEPVVLALLAALAEAPCPAVEERVLVLAAGGAGPVRRAALRAAVAIPGSRAEVILLRSLADRDPAIQMEALDLLVARGGGRATTTLLALLQAGDSLRYHVIRALGRLRAPEAVAPLESLYPNAALHERAEIIGALSEIGGERVRPFLLETLGNGELELRRLAARGLAQLAGPSDLPLLERLAADPDWVLRSEAARGLGRLPRPAADAPLLQLARDLEPAVARTARAALAAR